MATRAKGKAQRRSRWLHHFEQREASDLSVKAYIALHGLSQASWYAARKRYAESTSGSCMALRIHLRTGAVVELDMTLLALPQVLAAVSSTC
jgi:hypothetical protein